MTENIQKACRLGAVSGIRRRFGRSGTSFVYDLCVQGFRVTIRSVRLETEHAMLVILGDGWDSRLSSSLPQRPLRNGDKGIKMLVLVANQFEIRFTSDNSSVTNDGFELSYEPSSGANLYNYNLYKL
jgi:hypothetical protein